MSDQKTKENARMEKRAAALRDNLLRRKQAKSAKKTIKTEAEASKTEKE